jgi:hypothetical protein
MKAHNYPELSATKVKPEEIVYIVSNVARLHEEGEKTNSETAMFILLDRYRGKRNLLGKCVAIMERLQCLSNLIQKNDERLRGWTMDAVEPNCKFTHAAVFAATALCSLRRGDSDRFYFDPDEFFDLALGEAESKGRG